MLCVLVRFLSCFAVEFGHCHLRGTSCHLHSIEFSHSFKLACKYWKQPKVNAILGNVGQYSCVQSVFLAAGSDRTAVDSICVKSRVDNLSFIVVN